MATSLSSPSDYDPDGRQLVRALGTDVVAKGLRQSRNTVCNWLDRGVPRGHRMLVAQLAQRHGMAVPKGFLPALPEA